MNTHSWPDPLQAPIAEQVERRLAQFWQTLFLLADLLKRNEHLLAEACTSDLRRLVLELMLALNGIQRPVATIHLNTYLGASQRAVLEKTLLSPSVSTESWIGRAVALVVIYRWYAPQLVEKFSILYPQTLEEETLAHLQRELPDWPMVIRTE